MKVLRNKREGKFAVESDVEEMFNRIKIDYEIIPPCIVIVKEFS